MLLRRRPENGLLGGMMEIPSTPWQEEPVLSRSRACARAPLTVKNWQALPGVVSHGFTHFRLELNVLTGTVHDDDDPSSRWCPIDALSDQALPTLMKKIVAHALARV